MSSVVSGMVAGYDTANEKLVVGTAREKFFDNFHDFDAGTWETVQTGSGMTVTGPLGGAAAGASPYINIASGTTASSKTIIRSRAIFSMPLELRYQISASQRIANNQLRIGFLEVDDEGNLVTSTAYATVPDVLGARNAILHSHDGVTATTAQLHVRAAGSALDVFANAFGTGFTTVATGTGPNWIAATTYSMQVERDRINARAWGQNLLTNTGGQFAYDRLYVNPNKKFKLYIIVENSGTSPASTTDWRVHVVNILDAARFDISPRSPGTTDASKAFPVSVTNGVVTTVSTVTALTTVTTAGTPAAPATPYFVNSAASTNGALVLTGTSGLQAFYATNTGATAAFVKLYNKATAPTVGTDVPEMIIPVPAAVSGVPGVAELTPGFNAYRFALGLGIAITGGVGDTDTTAVAAGQVKVKLSRTA